MAMKNLPKKPASSLKTPTAKAPVKRASQTITTTTTTRVRKTGGNSGYKTCGTCGGTGRVRAK